MKDVSLVYRYEGYKCSVLTYELCNCSVLTNYGRRDGDEDI
jgi:hypothetical protein